MAMFPPEIWHMICRYLPTNDLCSLRLTDRDNANIAAEYLIHCLRIDTSLDSFAKLRYIANHPTLSKGVSQLKYEAGLLADVGCIHAYKHHYELHHHNDLPMPEMPSDSEKTDRSMRLYQRRLKQFNTELEHKYEDYRAIYEEQQSIDHAVLSNNISKLRLKDLTLETGAACSHMSSPQFRRKYCTDCAIPLARSPAHTVWQLQHSIVPGLKTLRGLQISLDFFNGTGVRTQEWLDARFSGLRVLTMRFKYWGDDASSKPVSLTKSLLPTTLLTASATLKSLAINFLILGEDRWAGSIDDIISTSFPELTFLDLDFLKTTEDKLISMLKLQPKLSSLFLAFLTLTNGDVSLL